MCISVDINMSTSVHKYGDMCLILLKEGSGMVWWCGGGGVEILAINKVKPTLPW